MSFRIEFADLSLSVPPGCTVTVRNYSATDRGGPDQAELFISGQQAALWLLLNWLGQRVRIVNPMGRTVWYGLVNELLLSFSGFTLGASLADLANKVAVTYSDADATGAAAQAKTAWVQNAASQALFGIKELIFSAGDASTEQATAKAAELLANLAWPVGAPTMNQAGAGATVRCVGLWRTLGWRYYSNPNGRIEHTGSGGGSLAIGWRLTSTEIGFKDTGIFHLSGQLTGPDSDDVVVVTGSAGNNRSFTISSAMSGALISYTATTISFDVDNDIFDAANGLDVFSENNLLQVAGSAGNSRTHWLKNKASAGQVETSPTVSGAIVAEAAGPSITLRQGTKLATSESAVSEMPSATTTLTLTGYIVAQAFVPAINMTTGKVAVSVGKVGSPTDSLSVAICANSGGNPGTVLGTATILGSALADNEGDVWLTLPALALTAGTTYWLKISRTGSTDAVNYYSLGLADMAYQTTKAYNGSGWVAFTRAGETRSVPFRLWDVEDTSLSMARIVSQCGGTFVTTVTAATMGVGRCQYIDNDATALQELEKLIDLGATGGQRLTAVVAENGKLTVAAESAVPGLEVPMLHQDGRIYEAAGAVWDDGRLPVGEWIGLGGLPEIINSAWRISPIFVSGASYDVARRRLNLSPRSARKLLMLFQSG